MSFLPFDFSAATALPWAELIASSAITVQRELLHVCKNILRERKVSDVGVTVDAATAWARDLTHSEARGPGDMENAWRRLEHRYGVPWRMFWSLRYRRPKDIASTIYLRLEAAYQAECARQMRHLKHELEITRAKAGPAHAAVVAAEALVGPLDREET